VITDSTDSRGFHGFHGITESNYFFAPSGVLALFCPGAESRIPRGTDSTESRIPRGGIPVAKPLCPGLLYMRQLELLVFGSRPAARVGEGGLLKCVFVAVWLQLVTKTTARTVAAMPLGREVRSECGV
jgi:hypothetical protein